MDSEPNALETTESEDNEILIPLADMIQQLVDYGETLFLLSNELGVRSNE